jgi:ADP-ribosylglycohydrolase
MNLTALVESKASSGFDVDDLQNRLDQTPDNYQDLFDLAQEIERRPLREHWPYWEPNDLELILQEYESNYEVARKQLQADDVLQRAQSGFISSVVGCVLGKPVEIHLDSKSLVQALTDSDQYPLKGYISGKIRDKGGLKTLHKDAPGALSETISNVPPDDDINYTLLGLTLLETQGRSFTQEQLARLWRDYLPLGYTWGPERTFLSRYAMEMGLEDNPEIEVGNFASSLNPGSEFCGALIRCHIYGYSSPGDPRSAAAMAWRDATMTHRGNGVYGSMYLASVIALAFVERDIKTLFRQALNFIPLKSRLHEAISFAIDAVSSSSDWEAAYALIHKKYKEFGHCRIFQEIGTVINSVFFAKDIGDGLKIQLYQGNDTDSFGAAAGAILGVHFGENNLDPSWVAPFGDRLYNALGGFHDQSLKSVTSRVGQVAIASLEVK